MDFRITLSRPTVKAMHGRLQQAYARGDVRLVRRVSVLLEHLHGRVPSTSLSVRARGWLADNESASRIEIEILSGKVTGAWSRERRAG